MSDKGQLYYGGDIYTVDDSCPTAEAVAVQRGKIIAVDSKADCRKALGNDFESVDLKAKALLPGFIDTHLHPAMMIYFDINVDLTDESSIESLQDKMRARAESASAKEWIVGLRFEDQDLAEKRLPTRHDLDDACPDHAAVIVKHDGHMVVGNTRAIEAAKISASTDNPDGGVIDREDDGYPAGPFRENAAQLLMKAMPMPEIRSLTDGAKKTFSKLVAKGITSAGVVLQTHDEGPAGGSGAFEVLLMQMLADHIPINMYSLLIAKDMEQIEAARKTKLNNEQMGNRIGAIKIFADGTFGSCTAYMYEPFSDQPDKRGFMTLGEDEIYRRMVDAHKAGLQVCVHAIGDAANRKCVDLYEKLLKEHPKDDHRHRLEHASQLDAGTIEDIARLGLVVSTQPLFIHSEKSWLHKRLGKERAKMTYPFKSLLEAGVRVAGASDAPIESTDVLHAIQCCVTREGFEPGQGITAAEAVRMFTINAAYAQFEDKIKGSISVGKRADMVVLSDNPASVPTEKIRDIKVERTISGGKVLYGAEH